MNISLDRNILYVEHELCRYKYIFIKTKYILQKQLFKLQHS